MIRAAGEAVPCRRERSRRGRPSALYLEAGASAVLAGEGELRCRSPNSGSGETDLERVGGLTLPDSGATGPYRAERPDLDALPFPAWDLVEALAYRGAWRRARLSWNMAASRGCPYGCNWCAKPNFGRRYTSARPPTSPRRCAG